MKRQHLLLLALSISQLLSAQIFSKVETQIIEPEQTGQTKMAALSGNGQFAFLTAPDNGGLTMLNLQTMEKQLITDEPGAGFQPQVSEDGQIVLYRTTLFGEDKLRRTALKLSLLGSPGIIELTSPSRELNGYALSKAHASIVSEGKHSSRRVRPQTAGEETARPVVFIQDMQLMISDNGEIKQLSPNGSDEETSYLWPSLSPDGQKILYYVSDEGAYICDLRGENVQFISYNCRAPQWYDNNTIIGMNDKDDDTHFTSSSIVAFTLDGARQEITDGSLILMYPFCSAQSGRIVCSSAKGGIYILNVEK